MPDYMEDWEDQEDPYKDIVRTDSSFDLTRYFRSGWGAGEHLWDWFWNRNWTYLDAVHRAYRKIDWRVFPAVSLSRASGYSIVDPQDGQKPKYMPLNVWLEQFPGMRIYIEASRSLIVWADNQWRLIGRRPPFDPSIEIAFMISDPKPGQVCGVYTVESPFELYANNRWSRCRGVREQGSYEIRKNNSVIGQAIYDPSVPAGYINLVSDTSFAPGDQLKVVAPGGYLTRCASISFLGKAL
jgi:hypothetical protein